VEEKEIGGGGIAEATGQLLEDTDGAAVVFRLEHDHALVVQLRCFGGRNLLRCGDTAERAESE